MFKFASATNKARKNHGIAFYVVGLFTFAIEAMLGLNAAFLIDQSLSIVSDNMLRDTPLFPFSALIALLISLIVGLCFILGGMWTFAGFMRSLDVARAYIKKNCPGKVWPRRGFQGLLFSVIALDFSTLCFRATYFADKGAVALFIFSCILIMMPPILGVIIYVLENVPHDFQMSEVKVLAENRLTEISKSIVNEIDDDLLPYLLSKNDDSTPVVEDVTYAHEEHYRRMASRQAEQSQIAASNKSVEENRNSPLALISPRKQEKRD